MLWSCGIVVGSGTYGIGGLWSIYQCEVKEYEQTNTGLNVQWERQLSWLLWSFERCLLPLICPGLLLLPHLIERPGCICLLNHYASSCLIYC